MDSDRLNRWLTLCANIGVLIGIALLVVELNQNREMMRAQTRHQISADLVTMTTGIAENAAFASIHRRGNAGEDLTPNEYHQFQFHYISMFRQEENVHYQFRQGLFDEVEFSNHFDGLARVFRSDAVKKIWCEYRETLSPGFREEVERRVEDILCR